MKVFYSEFSLEGRREGGIGFWVRDVRQLDSSFSRDGGDRTG